ncbi:hypothetical protein BGZ95_007359 [Linnemannia exigua]|uniref:F-box domain-containing protein n=1 Tax=Linnemannia exigua TaxID=604196 RepID=A0AAD4DGY1_9FUNG|nr:hypothetical protein BGZ95_007359 [Linnemannia exigua]
MESATTRFFNIAELIIHVTRYLDDKGVCRLIQTSHHLNAICSEALYYNVKANFKPDTNDNVFSSVESIQALARNTHHVRQLDLSVPEIVYYTNCVYAFQGQLSTETDSNREVQEHRLSSQERPLWLPPLPDPRICAVFPMPAMRLLTKLELDLDYDCKESCPNYLPSCGNPKATLTHICWIMDCNPNLIDVILSYLSIKDHQDVRLLSKSISSLKRLQSLYVGARTRWDWESLQWRFNLLFSCWTTIQRLGFDASYMEESWDSSDYMNVPSGGWGSWERSDEEWGLTESFVLQEPCTQLTKLWLWDTGDEPVLVENFRSMLARCPNLTEIALPTITGIDDAQRLAEDIVQLCPKLSSIEFRDWIQDSVVCDVIVRTLAALPENQVRKFSCSSILPFEIHDLVDARLIFRRQSRTLRDVYLNGWANIDSKTIQAILVECEALDQFTVGCLSETLYIDLEDAISLPWACTRIQQLELTIAIPDQPLHRPPANTVPYYNRPPPTTLSATEEQQFGNLESLYRQIGALTELQSLNLRAAFIDSKGHHAVLLNNNTFPGMLNLRCEQTGRPGYLHHLSGLTKLRGLAGSVSAEMEETKVTIGMDEVVWMERHWPVLQRATFFWNLQGREPPEAFRWWKKQRLGRSFDIGV